MASYYKKIKGKNYDGSLLELADSVTKGKGDGRISLNDAKQLLKKVKDAGSYSDIEKKTMQYIRDNYKFTDEADKWFRTEIRKWAATKKSTEKSVAKTGTAKKSTKKKAAPKAKSKKTAKKAGSAKSAVKSAPAKKTAAKKKTAPVKKAVTKKVSEKAIPAKTTVPEKTADTSIPEPSPILKDREPEKKNGTWKYLAILLIIGLGIGSYLYMNKNGKIKRSIPEKPEKITAIADEKERVEDVSPEVTDPDIGTIEETRIYFAKGSGWLAHSEKPKLKSVISFFKENSNRKLEIIGHACNLGTPRLNKGLSEYRARNVAKYLKLKGVDDKLFITRGAGQKGSSDRNMPPEEQKTNRKVEFKIK